MKTEPRKRILVVDDDPSITKFLKLNLERTSRYEVRTENQPASALRVAEEFEPDLILLDVIMPETDGGHLAEEFHARQKLQHVPIVFLTAAATKAEVTARGGRIGGMPFIAKPVALPDLIGRMEEIMAACPRH